VPLVVLAPLMKFVGFNSHHTFVENACFIFKYDVQIEWSLCEAFVMFKVVFESELSILYVHKLTLRML